MLFARPLIFILSAELAQAARGSRHPGCRVSTTNGPIQGHPAENRSDVTEFLGIPFAHPPVGQLRFAAPQAYTGKGLYVASKFVSLAAVYLNSRLTILPGLVSRFILACSVFTH